MDEGCFCNAGLEDSNVGCDEKAARNIKGGCEENYFALRHIRAGEEILCDYGEFAIYDGWDHFELWQLSSC